MDTVQPRPDRPPLSPTQARRILRAVDDYVQAAVDVANGPRFAGEHPGGHEWAMTRARVAEARLMVLLESLTDLERDELDG